MKIVPRKSYQTDAVSGKGGGGITYHGYDLNKQKIPTIREFSRMKSLFRIRKKIYQRIHTRNLPVLIPPVAYLYI